MSTQIVVGKVVAVILPVLSHGGVGLRPAGVHQPFDRPMIGPLGTNLMLLLEDSFGALGKRRALLILLLLLGVIGLTFAKLVSPVINIPTAAELACYLLQAFAGTGSFAAMGAVLLLAIVLIQLRENAGVAAILAPLTYGAAEAIQMNPKPFMVGLATCVSAGFCTPFAHDGTILVMGPGQYRFKHYLQIGTVLALITWLVATFLTSLVWRLN